MVGLPDGLPAGTYDVEPVDVIRNAGGEPVMRLRFKPAPEPPKPETTFLLVEVDKDWVNHNVARIGEWSSVKSVTVHNEDHPHGCCCQHCPHNGNCRD
jgi:hypothetical protein